MVRLVTFDLDGTLIDSVPDLVQAINIALAKEKLPLKTVEEVRMAIGDGAKKLLQRVAPDADVDTKRRLRKTFDFYYKEHCCDQSALYPGVLTLLEALHKKGILLAVYSNKPVLFVRKILTHYFDHTLFCAILGQEAGYCTKPDATQLIELMQSLEIAPEEAVYVGDSDIDVQTALRAGIEGVSVLWGYRDRAVLENAGAQVVVETISELEKILLRS